MDTRMQEKIDKFFTQFKNQEYKKGELIIRADDNPSGVFYIKEGYVKQYAITKKGDELVVNMFKPIAFFPMSWVINESPNAYFYEAMTDLKMWRAPREEVIAFMKRNPDILYNLLSRLYKGVDGLLTRMTYLMAGNAYARLIIELIIQAKRFGKTNNQTVELRVSEKDLAAQSGMTRETISREIKILKDKELVLFSKNRLIINHLGKLEDELVDGV